MKLRYETLLCAGTLLLIMGVDVTHARAKLTTTYANPHLADSAWPQQQSGEINLTSEENAEDPDADNAVQPETRIGYSSVFDNYVPHDEIPEIGWREANDRVGEIGGWRAYLKMVQDASVPDPAPGDDSEDAKP